MNPYIILLFNLLFYYCYVEKQLCDIKLQQLHLVRQFIHSKFAFHTDKDHIQYFCIKVADDDAQQDVCDQAILIIKLTVDPSDTVLSPQPLN